MSPEISRRCRGCGASVRAGARFCPQCGTTMLNESEAAGRRRVKETPANYDATLPSPSELPQDVNGDKASDVRAPAKMKLEESTIILNGAGARDRNTDALDGDDPSRTESVEGLRATMIAAPPKRRHPVTVVEENLRPGVEKLREASIVMLDEAPDDSGLRFVLIGVALFLVFLLFLYITVFTY